MDVNDETRRHIASVISEGVTVRSDDHDVVRSTSARLEKVKDELIAERGSYNRLAMLYDSACVDLRDTQRALAASQADLTRVERERDEARAELNEMVARKHRMQRDLDAQLAEAREELANLRRLPLVGSDAGHQHEHPDGCTWPMEQCHGHTPDTPRTDAPGSNEGELPQ